MTTLQTRLAQADNPDPLEVWKAANRAYGQKETAHDYNNPDTRAERIRLADQAAAAIIAQHYAAIIAENERLRDALEKIAEGKTKCHHNRPQFNCAWSAQTALGAKP